MKLLTAIMPVYREPLMQRTIDSFLEASGLGREVEVIVVLDGPDEPWPRTLNLTGENRVKVIRHEENRGLRAAVNTGVAEANSKFIMKIDAHCMFCRGFDKTMVEVAENGWLVIPRRYALDEVNWRIIKSRWPRDHHYLIHPSKGGGVMTPHHYRKDWGELEIDDTMTFQGSCYCAPYREFVKRVGVLDNRTETYGTEAAEQIEVGMKWWLSGGEVKVTRRTWYAHLHKNTRHLQSGLYHMKPAKLRKGWLYSTDHWLHDREPGMERPFSWLVEKFWPVPTWPDDWREQL